MDDNFGIGLEPREKIIDVTRTKIVSIANFKGGQTKTTIASTYCRYMNGAYITNEDSKRIKSILSACIPQNKYFLLGHGEDYIRAIHAALPVANGRIVLDFGGYSDPRLKRIISNSDVVVIPFRYSGDLDLGVTLETIETFRAWNSRKFMIVISDTETSEVSKVQRDLEKLYGSQYPIKIVKRSKIARRLLRPGNLIDDEITEKGGQAKDVKAFREQLIDVFESIEKLLEQN